MGRESRQARRAKARREQEARRAQRGRNWTIVGGLAVIVASVLVFIFAVVFGTGLGHTASSSGSIPTPVESAGKTIDGQIGCNPGMEYGTVYHIHMHLSMYDAGKPVNLPALIGFNYNHDCLYWLHTHDTSGIIHLEAPKSISPTLGTFFDVWGEPLSTTNVGNLMRVKPGQSMRLWVNDKPFTGSPRDIRLTRHTSITIEVGPPWVKPKLFNFGQL